MFEQKSLPKLIILYLFAVVLTIMNLTNIKIAGLNDVMPMMDLMAIFYFAIFKNVFGLSFVFLLGIWCDALNGSPLGLTSLCYIILIKFFEALNNRLLTKENFKQVWLQFICFIVAFLILKWVLLAIVNGSAGFIWILVVQLIISSIFYVPMHMFFDYLSKKLIGD